MQITEEFIYVGSASVTLMLVKPESYMMIFLQIAK